MRPQNERTKPVQMIAGISNSIPASATNDERADSLTIAQITPVRRIREQDCVDCIEIRLEPSGQFVYVDESTLLSYGRCQKEILRQAGRWYEYGPVEMARSGASVWRTFVRDSLVESEYIPRYIENQRHDWIPIDLRKFRAGDYNDGWYKQAAVR